MAWQSFRTHFTFLVVSILMVAVVLKSRSPGTNESGSPFSSEIMFLPFVPHHCGQSFAGPASGWHSRIAAMTPRDAARRLAAGEIRREVAHSSLESFIILISTQKRRPNHSDLSANRSSLLGISTYAAIYSALRESFLTRGFTYSTRHAAGVNFIEVSAGFWLGYFHSSNRALSPGASHRQFAWTCKTKDV